MKVRSITYIKLTSILLNDRAVCSMREREREREREIRPKKIAKCGETRLNVFSKLPVLKEPSKFEEIDGKNKTHFEAP